MISTFQKKIFGLVGAVRTGKGSVANFLTETRGFKQFAFGDQIKLEFGISIEDFEAAKIAGNIEELRAKLWEFSASKKKDDPKYFIKKVIDKVYSTGNNIVITDIRTNEEFSSFYEMQLGQKDNIKRIYWVIGDSCSSVDSEGRLNGSKLLIDMVQNHPDLRQINNDSKGLYSFYKYLDRFFFTEDVEDICNDVVWRQYIRNYINQFEIRVKESRI